MYPSTTFIVEDKTKKNMNLSDTVYNEPIQVVCITADKGPEEYTLNTSENFFKRYGKKSELDFNKHGQPLIQAANIVNNGGSVFVQRVFAEDSTLANAVILAKVIKHETQLKNDQGELLYFDAETGKQTTDDAEGNTPVLESSCTIKYECQSVTNISKLSEIVKIMDKKYDVPEEEDDGTVFTYPLFIIADNGRGVSNKRFRITPAYSTSKYLDYMKYKLDVIENNEITEYMYFSTDHNVVENNKNISLANVVKRLSLQIQVHVYEEYFTEFMQKVADLSDHDISYCLSGDILFGKTGVNVDMERIKVDLETGFNLSYVYGIDLTEGSNGAFGNSPFGTEAYIEQACKFFNGEYTPKIFDLENYPIDLIIDANYPQKVKRSIETLVNFREDCIYMRDIGLGVTTIDEAIRINGNGSNSCYIMPYCTSYDIENPSTRKHINVTIGYSLSRLMITHFKNGRSNPIAGFLYNMIIPEAIEGTVNIEPIITPSINQRKELDDARLNYCAYHDNMLTIQTLYTAQEDDSQLSYGNNVIAIQEVIKAVRKRCPKIRYSFATTSGLEEYQNDVNKVLEKYKSNFDSLQMYYATDEAAIDNKQYYAIIEVVCKEFVQAEKFKLLVVDKATSNI